MRSRIRYIIILCLAALAVSGCGSKEAPGEESRPEPETTVSAQESAAATETPKEEEKPAAEEEKKTAKKEDASSGKKKKAAKDKKKAAGEKSDEKEKSAGEESAYIDKADVEVTSTEEEAKALASSEPSIPTNLTVSAPGIFEARCDNAVIDYSNSADGYVMVQFTGYSDRALKALVNGPTTQYQYNLTPQMWATLPLSDGNGDYRIGIYENVEGTSYACVLSENISVQLTDEFAPFLRPNQYVNYEAAPDTIRKAAELCVKLGDPLEKVGRVYDFVVKELTYDRELAETVQSGYLPDLDLVLSRKQGICFDYAALMTGMLRSQGVPCKLVIGYAGAVYHAWISVYSENEGWIDGAVYFDGTTWQRMDPTFASSSNRSDSIMEFIGDGTNYESKYFY